MNKINTTQVTDIKTETKQSYQYYCLDFVSNEELFADCQCGMMLVDDTLENCLFYSEYDLSNIDRLCFADSIIFLKMVSARSIHFNNDA